MMSACTTCKDHTMGRIALFCLFLGLFQLSSLAPYSSCKELPWPIYGHDLYNSRNARKETKINLKTVSTMRLKWRFVAGFDVSATPSISDGVVYFPSWNGNLYAVSEDSGKLIWMKNLTLLTGFVINTNYSRGANATLSRSTPTVVADRLIFGLYGPSAVLSVNRSNGDLLWMTRLEHTPGGVITMSGTAYNGAFYIGSSTLEENFPALCCVSQGRFVKLDIQTGAVIWETLMLPDNKGVRQLYSGASVWGSSPSIDHKRNHIYITTGELHWAPPEIQACQAAQLNKSVPDVPNPCIEAGNHMESMLALDLDSGEIKWANNIGGWDAWVSACNATNSYTADCPVGPNPDIDFSVAPSMLTIEYWKQSKKYKRDIVVAGQKSGVVTAVDRNNGKVIWSTQTGPGKAGGGQIWGIAVDKDAVYVNVPDGNNKNWTLIPANTNITTGGWTAVNATTGEIMWAVANPTRSPASAPLSISNGVLFGGSMDKNGTIFGLDARSGAIVWNATTGATVYGGSSISNGCIYIGDGASVNVGPFYGGTQGDSVFAFCVHPKA